MLASSLSPNVDVKGNGRDSQTKGTGSHYSGGVGGGGGGGVGGGETSTRGNAVSRPNLNFEAVRQVTTVGLISVASLGCLKKGAATGFP